MNDLKTLNNYYLSPLSTFTFRSFLHYLKILHTEQLIPNPVQLINSIYNEFYTTITLFPMLFLYTRLHVNYLAYSSFLSSSFKMLYSKSRELSPA